MDQLPALGRDIAPLIAPTVKIYGDLLKQNRSAIESTRMETHAYGPTPRQSLDVYYPAQPASDAPVLIFLYGGGLVAGDKKLTGPDGKPVADGLIYAGLGHFFAEKHGFITIVADYRLERHQARFPSGGEDYSLVIAWAMENLGKGTKRDLFLTGQSAGGLHLATYLLHADFDEQRKALSPQSGGQPAGLTLKAAACIATPYDFEETAPYRRKTVDTYFNDDARGNCPLGLLEKLIERKQPIMEHIEFMTVINEFDPREVEVPHKIFTDLLLAHRKATILRAAGHNHVSCMYALGTGIDREENWANRMVRWFKAGEHV